MKNSDSFGWRYQIVRTIGSGNMGTVYQATDRYTGQDVALKAIYKHKSPPESNLQATLAFDTDLHVALAHEFRALASLRHPNVITVKDYGFVEGHPYFTMELLENNQDLLSAAKDLSLDEKFDIVKQVLQALTYIHQRGIIHRDLKPDNIQIINGQAKLLDFGLAISESGAIEKMAGTLAYMAPEILLGNVVNERSDLFALGMMIYELLVGEYPFETADIAALIQHIVYDEIPLDSHLDDDRLINLLGKLLNKQAEERFESAREVLNYCVEHELIKGEVESQVIRESFLQAAQFVGREAEFKQLNSSLQFLLNGKGSAWFVAGESGVGKTRLLDELSIQAKVDGIHVVRGQTVQAGGTPYILMQDPLKQLCLSTTLTPEEIQTVIPFVPSIGIYLFEQARLQGTLDISEFKTGVRQNLVNTIEAIIRRQEKPILLILEDLHWVRESLPIVQHLTQLCSEVPLMILASYRDDEHPELAAQVPNMQTLKLERLSRDKIEALTSSIIGQNTGIESHLIDLIQRETEGNIFFIVEVMRVLAERAGHLDKITTRTLPINVFSGGIHAVVQRRLARLPEEMMNLLNLAALGGKQLDIKLLAHCNTFGIDMDRWLLQCDSAAVLEASGEVWQFTHDKIRTALIQAMSDTQKKDLHFQLAKTLEKLDDNALNPRYALIAFHYEGSGQLVEAISYYEKAAEQALRHYAMDNTQQYLIHIQTLEIQLSRFESSRFVLPENVAHRHRLAGEVSDAFGDWDSSRDHYEKVLEGSNLGTEDDMTISKLPVRSKDKPLTPLEQDLLFAIERLTTIYLFQGEWARAQSIIARQNALYFVLGYQAEWIETMALEAWTYFYQGIFKPAEVRFKRIFKLGKQKKLFPLLTFGGTGLIINAIRTDAEEPTLKLHVSNLVEQLAALEEQSTSVLLDGVLAFAYWRLNDLEQSQKYSKRALEAIENRMDFRITEFTGLVGVTETLLARAEHESPDAELIAQIALACKALHIFAQVYPLARPRAWIYQGREIALGGKQEAAIKAIEIAVKQAQQCNISYDEGVAYLTLARLVNDAHKDYNAYLDLAIARFTAADTTVQLEKAKAMKAAIQESSKQLTE